jgi:DedD protein
VSTPPDERAARSTTAPAEAEIAVDPPRVGTQNPPATKSAAVQSRTPVEKSVATQTASAAAPPAAATPERGTWSVQVGAFGSAGSARRLIDKLEAEGFSAYVSEAQRDGKTLYRVRVGPEDERAQADTEARRLKARGFPVSIVAND